MSDDERQIRAVIEYIEDMGEPGVKWPKREFEMLSYSRWAANTILASILAHPNWTPIRATEEFKYEMSKYLYKPTNYTDVEIIFQSAYDTATDISDILMAMIP
jgi:hypothetical protein